MSQRSEEHCDELKAEMKLLKQDLHTAKKEFILACKICCYSFPLNIAYNDYSHGHQTE